LIFTLQDGSEEQIKTHLGELNLGEAEVREVISIFNREHFRYVSKRTLRRDIPYVLSLCRWPGETSEQK
jgi:hypothetical protein